MKKINLTLRRRMLLIFVPVLILMGVMGGIIIRRINTINDLVQANYEDGLVNVKQLSDIASETLRVRERLLLLHNSESLAEQQRQYGIMNQHIAQVSASIDEYLESEEAEEEGSSEAGIDELMDDFNSRWDDYVAAGEEVAQLTMSGDREQANIVLTGDAQHKLDRAISVLLLIRDVEDNAALENYAESQVLYVDSRNLTVTLTIAAIVIGVGLAYWLAQTTGVRLADLSAKANAIAGGDLEQRVEIRSKDEIGLLGGAFNSMAAQVHDLVANLESRVANRTRAIETSSEVSRDLSTILDPAQLITAVITQLQSAFNYYHAHIYLLDEENKNLVIAGGTGEAGEMMLADGHTIPLGKGLVGKAALTNTAVLAPDVSQEEGWLPNPLLPDTKAETAVPIAHGDEVLGVLDVQQNSVNGLGEEDVSLLQSIASQVAIALQNARQHTQVQNYAAELKEQQSQLQAVFEAISVPIVISNIADGIVAYVNDPMAETVRVPREELIGRVTPDFYANPEDRQLFLKTLQESGGVDNYEVQLKRSDGDLFWALISSRFTLYQGQKVLMNSVVDINKRKQTEALMAKQANELATVAQVSTIAATILEPQELLQELADLTKARFDLYHAHIHLLNEGKDTLVLTAGAGDIGRKMVAEGRRIPVAAAGSLVAAVARNQQGAIRNYETSEEGFMPHPLLTETRSEMAVPIAVGNEVLGVLDVRSETLNNFDEADMRTLTTLASQVAVALQNARSFQQSQKALHELDAITHRLTHEGWESYLDATTANTSFIYGSPPDSSDNKIEKEATNNVALPLIVQGITIGQLTLDEPQSMIDEAVSIGDEVAQRLSAHIENLRLTAQTEERAEELAIINQVAQDASQYLDPQQMLHAIYEQIQRVMPIDAYQVSLYDPEADLLRYLALYEDDTPVEASPAPLNPASHTAKAIQTGEPVTLNLTAEDQAALMQAETVIGDASKPMTASSIFMPLQLGQRVVGVMAVHSREYNAYHQADVVLLRGIASHVTVSLENARLFEASQARAQQERVLREVNDRITSAVDAESILMTAAQEVNRVLGLETFVYLQEPEADKQPEPVNGEMN